MKCFISYSHSVKAEVEQVVKFLQAEGHKIWWDSDIPSGADWWRTILDKIEWADVLIFVVSKLAVESVYCQAEIAYAIARNRPILPLVIDSQSPEILTKLGLQREQWLPYESDTQKMRDAFKRAFENLKKRPDIKAARPPEPNTGGVSLVQQLKEARDFAEKLQFKEAIQLFRGVEAIDPKEWGEECLTWIARLTSYEKLVASMQQKLDKERIEKQWIQHELNFGIEYDPYKIDRRLHPFDLGNWIRDYGTVLIVIAIVLVLAYFAYDPLRFTIFTWQARAANPLIRVEASNGTQFYINQYEVSYRQYRLCYAAQACEALREWAGAAHFDEANDELPVSSVNAFQASQFCRWLNGRLPSLYEWVEVATASHSYTWPWGNDEPNAERVNMMIDGPDMSFDPPLMATVNSFEEGRTLNTNIYHMVDNVEEWTRSWSDGEWDGISNPPERLYRIGSSSTQILYFDNSWLEPFPAEPLIPESYLGFRCASD